MGLLEIQDEVNAESRHLIKELQEIDILEQSIKTELEEKVLELETKRQRVDGLRERIKSTRKLLKDTEERADRLQSKLDTITQQLDEQTNREQCLSEQLKQSEQGLQAVSTKDDTQDTQSEQVLDGQPTKKQPEQSNNGQFEQPKQPEQVVEVQQAEVAQSIAETLKTPQSQPPKNVINNSKNNAEGIDSIYERGADKTNILGIDLDILMSVAEETGMADSVEERREVIGNSDDGISTIIQKIVEYIEQSGQSNIDKAILQDLIGQAAIDNLLASGDLVDMGVWYMYSV